MTKSSTKLKRSAKQKVQQNTMKMAQQKKQKVQRKDLRKAQQKAGWVPPQK